MDVYIGMDIGGTKIIVAAADEQGKILNKVRSETPYNFEDGIVLLKNMIKEVSTGKKIKAIGASIGGPLDWKNGIVSPLHQPEWRNIPLKKIFEDEFDCPFYVDVDTNIAALGEWIARNGTPKRLLYLTISTGMGGGFVVDGKIYRGADGEHPEIGHQSIKWSGNFEKIICECGAEDCLEELVSGNGIKRLYKKPAEALTDDEWMEIGFNLGQGLRNLSLIYTPDLIAIGGGVAFGGGEKLLKPAREIMNKSLKIVPIPKVELSIIGYEAALIGAITLAMEGAKIGY